MVNVVVDEAMIPTPNQMCTAEHSLAGVFTLPVVPVEGGLYLQVFALRDLNLALRVSREIETRIIVVPTADLFGPTGILIQFLSERDKSKQGLHNNKEVDPMHSQWTLRRAGTNQNSAPVDSSPLAKNRLRLFRGTPCS